MNHFKACHENKGEEESFLNWLKKGYNEIKKGLDTDKVIVICGKERTGKSTLACRLSYDLDSELCYNKKPNVKFICINSDNYMDYVRNNKKTIVVYDEAGTGMYSRDAMTKETREVNKFLMICGHKNIIHFILIPKFFDLDTKVRTQRLGGLIRIMAKGKFVTYKEEEAIKIGVAKDWSKGKICTKGWWPKNDDNINFNNFINAYKIKSGIIKNKNLGKKNKKKGSYTKEEIAILLKEKLDLPRKNIASVLGKSKRTISTYRKLK